MIRNLLPLLPIFLCMPGMSQNPALHHHQPDTTILYRKDLKHYELLLENKKQGFFWDTLKSDAFASTQLSVKNNSGETIILKNIRQEGGTISFLQGSSETVIYPDSSIKIRLLSGRRQGPFTAYLRISYTKGTQQKQSDIVTWGYYQPALHTSGNLSPAEQQAVLTATQVQAPKTIVREQKTAVSAAATAAPKPSAPPVRESGTIALDGQQDYMLTLLSGDTDITALSYMIVNRDTIRSTPCHGGYSCFMLNARQQDALRVRIINGKRRPFVTTIFFHRAVNRFLTIRLPNNGERYHYTGHQQVPDKVVAGSYLIKSASLADYRIIQDLLSQQGLLEYNIHQAPINDRVRLADDMAAAEFEKQLRARGVKATLEPATEWRGDIWETEHGKAVHVAKAFVSFDPHTTPQRMQAILKALPNVSAVSAGSMDCGNGQVASCPAYWITVHSCLYKDYMAIYDKLWNTSEVRTLEQIRADQAD